MYNHFLLAFSQGSVYFAARNRMAAAKGLVEKK